MAKPYVGSLLYSITDESLRSYFPRRAISRPLPATGRNTFESARTSKSRRSRVHESIAFSRFGLLLNRKQIPRFVETYVVSESGEMIVRPRQAPYTASAASTCVYKGPTTRCGPRRLDSGFDNYDLEDE